MNTDSKVVAVQVIYNSRKFIEPVFTALFNQTYPNLEVVAVISGNDDGGKELLAEKFPQVKIFDPGYNIGFARGHNWVFENFHADFFQLVNPDLVMWPDYVEKILLAFDNPKVGAATGKLYQFRELLPQAEDYLANKILDTTGVVISPSGRARDRGQHETDSGRYDKLTRVQAVSAAGAMYRAAALKATEVRLDAKTEYFDEDFHSYWEDVDLAWRMTNAGWECSFVPEAVAYHGRGAGSSRGGYLHFADFVRHHKALPQRVRQLNYQNHIFMYIKNARRFSPQFFVREFFMFWYVLFFEIGTFKILPQMLRLLSRMRQKRKLLLSK